MTLAVQRRIPRGTSWLFHWAATDGDFLPPDGTDRQLHPGEQPIGTAITDYYRNRVLAETGISRRWWNSVVSTWVEAGIACRCDDYKSVFLFVLDGAACRRCGVKTRTQSSQEREVRVPAPGSESSRFERESQAATKGAKQGAPVGLDVPGIQGPKAVQKSRGEREVKSADEAWATIKEDGDAAANL